MKVNSEHLYNYINDLATDEKVKFKVYYNDNYVTEIYWNGESFEWDTGTFTSEAFFNPLYDFEVIEEDKKIEKIEMVGCNIKVNLLENETFLPTENLQTEFIIGKINEIIDKINGGTNGE